MIHLALHKYLEEHHFNLSCSYFNLILCSFPDNLSDDDIGDPILDVVLEPGDLLYFPRGTIHQV